MAQGATETTTTTATTSTLGTAAATPASRGTPWRLLAPLLIIAVGVIAYSNSLNGPLIFDDLIAIGQNRSIRTLWPPHKPLIAPRGTTFAPRPIVNLSFALSYAMFGPDVRGYHVTNIFLHVCAALALYGLMRRTLRLPGLRPAVGRGNPDALALAITLLWEAHPMLTEVVTYTSTRTEGLMGLFFLLTLYCAVRAFESERPTRPRKWYALAILCCAIGMGCKEVMVAAPLMVFLYDALLVSHDGSFLAPLRRRPIFYTALAATWAITPTLLLTMTDLTAHSGEGLGKISPWHYLLTQSGVITLYLRRAIWPSGLTIDHFDWPIARSVAAVWPHLLLIGALLAATAWGLLRRRPWALLGAWVFAILAPTSSFLPLGSEVVAERRMYLPIIAMVTALVLLGRRMVGDRPGGIAAALVAILVIALTIATLRRNADYATAVTIWTDTVEKRPRNLRALSELARLLAAEGRHREARGIAERVVDIDANYPKARGTLGAMLIGENRLDEAIEHLQAAVQLDPGDVLARTNLGLALARAGRTDQAIVHYREALKLNADFVDIHVYLADALAASGDVAAALSHLEIAMKLRPDAADIRAQYNRLKQ